MDACLTKEVIEAAVLQAIEKQENLVERFGERCSSDAYLELLIAEALQGEIEKASWGMVMM